MVVKHPDTGPEPAAAPTATAVRARRAEHAEAAYRRVRYPALVEAGSDNRPVPEGVAPLPAAVLARTLGIHIDVAVQWQRATSGDWTRYLAAVGVDVGDGQAADRRRPLGVEQEQHVGRTVAAGADSW
jgi:hypothetical protein